jgi:chromosome segregation ATPase
LQDLASQNHKLSQTVQIAREDVEGFENKLQESREKQKQLKKQCKQKSFELRDTLSLLQSTEARVDQLQHSLDS